MSSIRTETRALRRGFTLIEVMVAITITFILATVLYKLLASQTRFTALNSAQQEVQQNARGALEMIAADIRVTPSGGIATAGLNTVTLYVPKAFGILCTSSSSDMIKDVALITSEQATLQGRTFLHFTLEARYEEPDSSLIETVPLIPSR